MLNVVILAAGLGKRMQSALPKVLHPIAGKPMLEHVLDSARLLQPDRIVVVVGHGAETVEAKFAGQDDLRFVIQQPQQGTGHAVMQAVPELLGEGAADTTLVLYGDVPLVQPDTLQALLDARQEGLAILTEHVADPTGYGRIVRDESGFIARIVEHKDASDVERAINEVNTGILAAPTSRLKLWLDRLDNSNAQGEYYLTDVVGFSVSDGVAVSAAHPAHSWETLGVNSRVQQAQLERAWQEEQARRLLEQGVTIADPARFDLRGTLSCGRDVFIDVGCVFEGDVVLGDGVHIAAHCVLSNVTLGEKSRIEAFSHLDQTTTQSDVKVGPFARLRPGTRLGEGAQIGNFVEVKNSHFGPASKASHLSYIGDAVLGEQVNVGAGTITCNYDGANKHQTIIEDNVFIGSDTQLVAPVRVGKGATIGAGTTVTRDVPADSLTISRSPQKTIDSWVRPTKKKAES
ncbi:bifunctional UDP-N-acetylglucosamine diphosphorylase/glucosamine-1-phosphate N-acetyltransferase GlmU [Paenalcaligenes niemegkensis]|uniref:bifunctional UDP-N-acetylglucosamine diphosphorylase/glucosamine-1-phosphate N-acetyltransferase GlmU n=1 Tax=Paenalcaligenes niemegkensis TaxID=2895469 RepID=UPI001EE835C1|nr:bifunctional UDP-N-acetylglucosamine diphosphorylase/glucosamine-1-phosphate N-acetyltransferase GlmU [Paenalcaligenes niemegkensis]MCQ9617716.1 bifunctional UDP-N-acetylglucosamine diphosphorylase/glucosamine-1-phosphate N-acetyltransferase GlmU [Paenalcaligenes niemegkensis]